MDSSIINACTVQCRACLTKKGTMKSMYESKIHEDYYNITEVQVKRSEGISELLCSICEEFLQKCIKFKIQCLRSNLILQKSVNQKSEQNTMKIAEPKNKEITIEEDIRYKKNILTLLIRNNEITILVCNRDIDAELNLCCPNCNQKYTQKKDLQKHLKDQHNLGDIPIKEEHYCPFVSCKYFIDSGNNKFFTKKKLLKQHLCKVHLPKTINCEGCSQIFNKTSDLNRHLRVCSKLFYCQICNISYKVKESYCTHVLRKHPKLHKELKQNKSLKRHSEDSIVNDIETKKDKFAINEYITSFPIDRNSTTIETQTVLIDDDDLLSIKPNNYDDSLFFPESVSDTQTQTWPVTSNKETNTSLTTNVKMRETQTCFCGTDSPSFGKLYFDPSNFISTQTQTAEFKMCNIKSDVMLSFSSAETQTCFENELENGF